MIIWLAPGVALAFLVLTVIGLRLGLAVHMGVFGWGALLGGAVTWLMMR